MRVEEKSALTDKEAMQCIIDYNEEIIQEAIDIWNFEWSEKAMRHIELNYVYVDDDLVDKVKKSDF